MVLVTWVNYSMCVTSLLSQLLYVAGTISSLFYMWGSWGSERLRYWPQIIQLVSGRAKIRRWSQDSWPTYVRLWNPTNTPESNALVLTIICLRRGSVVSRTLGLFTNIKWNPNSYRQGAQGQEVSSVSGCLLPSYKLTVLVLESNQTPWSCRACSQEQVWSW